MSAYKRRDFLSFLAALGAACLPQRSLFAQDPPPLLPPHVKEKLPGSPDPSGPSTKSILEQNEKNIKRDIEKLYELATQLKTEVEKTDSSTVLSVALVKKAEEIEKLAKQIKERAKG